MSKNNIIFITLDGFIYLKNQILWKTDYYECKFKFLLEKKEGTHFVHKFAPRHGDKNVKKQDRRKLSCFNCIHR